jgi:hypothetical protein
MAFVLAERVRETTVTTGTGTLNLAGATPAMRTFVAGIGNGNTTRYCLVSGDGSSWEIGTGTVTAGTPDTLARSPSISTNGNAAIALTGTSRVFCVVPASASLLLDEAFGSTEGQILQRGASGWQVLAPGTAGQALISGGASALNSWGAAGAMSLISTQTATSSATLDWAGLSGFTTYRLVGRYLLPAADPPNLWIRFGTGGGPTYATSGYNWAEFVTGSSGSSGRNSNGTGETTAGRVVFNVHNAAPGVGALDMLITTDGTYASYSGTAGGYLLTTGQPDSAYFAGFVSLGAALTGVRLMFNTGNITSGNASLYSVGS